MPTFWKKIYTFTRKFSYIGCRVAALTPYERFLSITVAGSLWLSYLVKNASPLIVSGRFLEYIASNLNRIWTNQCIRPRMYYYKKKIIFVNTCEEWDCINSLKKLHHGAIQSHTLPTHQDCYRFHLNMIEMIWQMRWI